MITLSIWGIISIIIVYASLIGVIIHQERKYIERESYYKVEIDSLKEKQEFLEKLRKYYLSQVKELTKKLLQNGK